MVFRVFSVKFKCVFSVKAGGFVSVLTCVVVAAPRTPPPPAPSSAL